MTRAATMSRVAQTRTCLWPRAGR